MGFGGLVYTDSMSMDAVAKMVSPDEGAVRAFARRRRSDAALAGSDCGVHRPQGGARERPAVAGAARRIGRARAARQGVGRPAPAARDRSRRRAGRRSADARTRRSAQEAFARAITLVKDDRRQVPLTVAARCADPVSVGARLPVGLADRGAEPDVHPGAEEALAEGDVDRSVRSHADVGARSRARGRAALRRDRRVGVRALRRRAADGWISGPSWCGC